MWIMDIGEGELLQRRGIQDVHYEKRLVHTFDCLHEVLNDSGFVVRMTLIHMGSERSSTTKVIVS